MDEHLYLVTYDIRDDKRLRRVFKTMKGFGEWLQLSVFQCRLSRRRHAEMLLADKVKPRVVSLGDKFEPVAREPIIV